jgi:hypothetical protein
MITMALPLRLENLGCNQPSDNELQADNNPGQPIKQTADRGNLLL